MENPSENPQVAEYRALASAVKAEERAVFDSGAEDQEQLLEWCMAGEAGAAKLFIHLKKGRLLKDHNTGLWYQMSDHHWKPCEKDEPLAQVEEIIPLFENLGKKWFWRKMNAIKADSKEEAQKAQDIIDIIFKRIASLQRRRYRQDVLTLAAAGDDSLGINGREWDRNPMLVPFRNGVFDLLTATFRPGRPDDFIKTFCPVDWLGFDVPCPRWEKFIKEILNERSALVGYLKRLLGSGLSGQVLDHILIILWGEYDRNGKTVLCEILAHIMGELYTVIPGEFLLSQKYARSSAAPSPDIIAIKDRRYVVASETGENRAFDGARVKLFTGGDRLTGRGPYDRRMQVFRPTHTMLMLTNFRPKINPKDQALWQRIHLVKFGISFVDNPEKEYERPRNLNLAEELKEEASGILSWLVAGFFEWQEKGLDPPLEVLENIKEYQKSMDSVKQFIEECCIVAKGKTVRAEKLFEEYVEFCKSEGLEGINKNAFGTSVYQNYGKGRDNKGNYYKGLCLKFEAENPLL